MKILGRNKIEKIKTPERNRDYKRYSIVSTPYFGIYLNLKWSIIKLGPTENPQPSEFNFHENFDNIDFA